ncbi:glycoside hydrolase family 16 protein [Lysobacter capsici]|uniref:glycoside hydrolase family 16 protein n=1 Tax=Lysobacter capsici TaxID=435897 RepID=UPI00287B8768|nr:glycoside hydrolase family 16 protein [Lysobacter capsici]WND80027.1 glycoside hydrolase family 16 protein [Lysobacter capsici]WND85223.1 glycoside hydrolase family 16 protein [Lysobacter capsici]
MKLLMKGMLFFVACMFADGASAQTWQLAWSDEFNGSIGPSWVFETGNGSGGWGNNELQYYRRENAAIENNALVITARRQDFGGFRYTSARMKTQGVRNFRYGKIEARMRLPSFMGAWPAFWALGANLPQVGWPASGEIDIMEHVNNENRSYGTIHWRDHNGNYAQYGGNTAVSVADWHVYSVEWDANAIRWYVDGNKFHEANIQNSINGTDEFHRDFFLLLNFAIGGNWPGFNVDESKLPAKMHVDYVRVYRRL